MGMKVAMHGDETDLIPVYWFIAFLVGGWRCIRFGNTFDMLALKAISAGFQHFWFLSSSSALCLGGIFLHNWSPDGHVAAPTAVSMFHAGVLMKLGAFAALRVGIMLLPEGASFHLPWIIVLTLVNVVYGAFIAMVQTDFKYVIGFSSVSHMGLVLMGFATLTREGFLGSGVQMFSHGIMTALFFAVVGMVYDQAINGSQVGRLWQDNAIGCGGFYYWGLVSWACLVFRIYR
jgi:NADH-quinone oxidoreductase subunit M